ncbi:MAG: sugar ABC transporter permease [Eubacterium sp.]|nr:sugar ABC transporter permease [Eubacterium sp.]
MKNKPVKNQPVKRKAFGASLLYLAPSLAGVLFFYMAPFADVLKRSFQDDMCRRFVGMENYAKLFQSRSFLLAGKNTLFFILCSTPLLLALSLCLAVLLHQHTKKYSPMHTDNTPRPILAACYLLPLAIPVAALAGIWKIFFHEYGLFNALLDCFGIAKTDWINTEASMFVVIATYLWRNLGYTVVLWLAGLSAIDPLLYEAAALDGADEKKQFSCITLPLLKPLGFTVSVLAVLSTFKVFRDIYLISGDYPNKSIYMIQHLLNNWFTNMEFGKITAAALVILLIAGWLVLGLQICFSLQKRRNYYG